MQVKYIIQDKRTNWDAYFYFLVSYDSFIGRTCHAFINFFA